MHIECPSCKTENKIDYADESKHGYHPIEFLFNKVECLEKFNSEALLVDNKTENVNKICFTKPLRDITIRKLNIKKQVFAQYVTKNKDTIDFENFKPLLEQIEKAFKIN